MLREERFSKLFKYPKALVHHLQRLYSLIGLVEIKVAINLMIKKHIVRLCDEHDVNHNNNECNHMLLVGKSGTGKTTVAEIISNIICAMGFINPIQDEIIDNKDTDEIQFLNTINLVCKTKLREANDQKKKLKTISCIVEDVHRMVNSTQDKLELTNIIIDRVDTIRRVLNTNNTVHHIQKLDDIESDFNPIFIQVTRKDLIGNHVGSTANKTANKIMESMGGVLFIDEAYGLVNKDGSGEVEGFSSECMTTLCEMMSKYARNFVCILTGYTQRTVETLLSNEGMKRRITYTFQIADYTKDEVTKIFVQQLNRAGLKLHSSINPVTFISKNWDIISKDGGSGCGVTGKLIPIIGNYYSMDRFEQIFSSEYNKENVGVITQKMLDLSMQVITSQDKIWSESIPYSGEGYKSMYG